MYRIFFTVLFLSLVKLTAAQKVDVNIKHDAIYFTEGQKPILKYQTAEKSLNGNYARSNYIHPLYTLDGEIITEDFPSDHPHQRGVFWAWHQLYIGNKRIGDGWAIKDFHWDVDTVKVLNKQSSAKAIQSEILWKSPVWLNDDGEEKPVVKEITTIKVYPAENRYRPIDIKISIYALEKNMRLGGSEDQKGYGGFSARIRLPNDITFSSSTGNVRPNKFPIEAGRWMDFSGSLGKEGVLAGLTILCHPDNPGNEKHWILRASNSMQNAVYPFPGANTVDLSETQPTILRYRLLIHKGDDEHIDIPKIYADYAKE